MNDQQSAPTFFELTQLYALTKAELDRLDRLMQEAKARERDEALVTVQALIDSFGFTAVDLKLAKATKILKKCAMNSIRIKKYLHSETGAEWSGQGMEPTWIRGKDKNLYENPAWRASKSKN
ncbi:H-NS histone family protein [Massilia antarctica]|uniref:H-NS histone family protein n=1 Tax=Massilia antarctica TaxID=2765360 RepID=UPI00226F95DE|nr:H-NS histone family protein [Massilia sp. H27-R4]MCY0910310.1 H-NS histone family protein [Massilia sp. H27-R4]